MATITNETGQSIVDAINNLSITYDNYLLLAVDTTDWNETTLEGETCYNKIIQNANFHSGKHPIISVKCTKPSTMSAECEAFADIIQIEEQNNQLVIYAKNALTTAIVLQIKNY